MTMLLQKRKWLEHSWFYYYLLLLPFFLWHYKAVGSQAGNIILRVNRVAKSLKNQHLTNNKFYNLQNCQNQQQKAKQLARLNNHHYSSYLHTTLQKECTSIYASGSTSSGIYPIWLKERFQFTYVYCDMDLVSTQKGWTTIQRRMNGEFNFERGWDDYVKGFGNPSSEHWLGLENIYRLSRQTAYSTNTLGPIHILTPEVGFDLQDWEEMKAFVQYANLLLGPKATNYWLDLGGLNKAFRRIFSSGPISGYSFSTPDRDNDNNDHSHCASKNRSGGWFNGCVEPNLNGPYPKHAQLMSSENIYWGGWLNFNKNGTALRFVFMKFYHGKIRP
ncbi:microfibril-associated glycoprotein 4-like [Clavelina lepadiformis]|uniref:microfibril-associated glycoprotein 4-like n=1 Tax=Clavelina lepadiformis TaxID=159417 RepID=UPI0040428788